MSTNHNRIKVADLEKNQPNKTLITNDNGELEFSSITGGEQDLQSVLNNGTYAQRSNGNSIINLFGDVTDEESIELMISNGLYSPGLLHLSSLSMNERLTSFNNFYGNDSSRVKLEDGDLEITRHSLDTGKRTSIKILRPLDDTTINFPGKSAGTYTLATLEEINDNFVHKTGEVNEVIDGFKTFRFPITFRGDASAAYTTVDSTEIKFTVDANDNSSITIKPNRESFDEDENYSQELQAKSGIIALLSDFKTINGVSVVGSGNIVTSSIPSGTPNSLSKYNAAGNNLISSNITDNGSNIVINKPTEINSGIANTSGLKFTNLKTNSNWISEWVGTIEDSSRNIALDSFGNMYVQSDNSKNIIKITPEGVSTVFVTLPSYPYGIIIDSGNNVYVTTNAGNVTKITPAGIPTILGTTGTNPRGLVFDSTGNIYVANYSSNNVSKITPAGVSTILGTTGTNPNNIVIDSLGNLYTVNFTSRNVSKITPSGASTILGTTGSDPVDIAIDSIGNVYVTNTGTGNVSKITPAGASTIFSSLPSGLPFGIIVDAMDNVLYSDWDNGLVKITPAGISTVLSPSSSFDNPMDIVLDATGNVYVCNRGRRTPKLTKITAPETPKLLAVNSNGEVMLSKIIGNVAPTSATATGTVGEIRVAAGYIYWCTAPNTWIRAAGSAF